MRICDKCKKQITDGRVYKIADIAELCKDCSDKWEKFKFDKYFETVKEFLSEGKE